MTPSPEEMKGCCAAAYESDLVALVLGESYHPGGLELTRHLAVRLGLRPGDRVLDVAAGRGTTAFVLASELGVTVTGVDLSDGTVGSANEAARERRIDDRVRFEVADAEELQFPDESFDAVVCECAFCTFPDKPAAAAEFARVLRPGGRVGVTDVVCEPDQLPGELRGLAGWVACIADARPLDAYRRLLGEAGMHVRHTEGHHGALTDMIDRIEARLRALRVAKLPVLEQVDLDEVRRFAALAREAVAAGVAGYELIVAEKPQT